ncbi:MAG: MqnA/MqnD/SBP family protein [Verrucomicrobiota bacterium]|nr:MqnA/MqnD/SBP family protein [Verrucomicrobiota bacterium]
MIKPRLVTLGHSPDPDDAFMFYALKEHRIETHGWEFDHILQDIQTLNERAMRGDLDISAVSIHAYSFMQDKYALLPCGASMGDQYGPMLVEKTGTGTKQFAPGDTTSIRDSLKGKTIAVPGLMTSAFLSLQIFWGSKLLPGNNGAGAPEIVIVPFDEIFNALKDGKADVGLLIHEGQLTYAAEGFDLIVDLGVWWFDKTGGLPLPLGGNVIHKRFTPEERRQLNLILKESIQYSLDHRAPAVTHSMQYGRGLDTALADRFVGMYVNELTLDYGQRGRDAISLLLKEGYDLGILPQRIELEFVQ